MSTCACVDQIAIPTAAPVCTSTEPLYVIAVVSNPVPYKRRYTLFMDFIKRMSKVKHIKVISVELQQGVRPFATDSTLKLRTDDEVWVKENLINLGVRLLPPNWRYVAWIDTDITFQREDWAEETLLQLQSYDIVQLFSHAVDLGPNYEYIQTHTGFAYQYVLGDTWQPPQYGRFWHPGYAWACTRRAFNAMGGLVDFAILGSADHHMALAWIGLVEKSMNHDLHPNYKQLLLLFQDRCERFIRRKIGYVSGLITHSWHGAKKNRRYKERWKILTENKFDPIADIYKDWQGVWQLDHYKLKLRDDVKAYFRGRNEDSIDLE
jgi:hypothetical protein